MDTLNTVAFFKSHYNFPSKTNFAKPTVFPLDTFAHANDTKKMKLANRFTLARVMLAPVFFLVYFIPLWFPYELLVRISGFALIPLLAITELTDFFDGHVARKQNAVSDLGKLFDPFADVMLHLTVFTCFLFSFHHDIGRYIHPAIFILIVYREFSQNFLRMIAAKQGVAIAARKGGKLKTVFYVLTAFVCLIPDCATRIFIGFHERVPAFISAIVTDPAFWKRTSLIFFLISLALSYISFADYLFHFKKFFKED